ncbi:MAG: nucleotidyltransferase domain-containing protein [Euryarchaeota archaeon]|nr:nucleotidyltransferase domain-containing protein [Euryarchaeota archaeon]MDE1836080.1 nucleotidyltransferase domain-containing protein [Euryarchaeota archaeon]MDE1879972.1 nucleotidyltransferase domain-containing protein [Euryarchaeota archaeon]MDE2044058.1 nucleotidyltransferase domain-containing protein [Thermoplasmata archaeon]
MTKAMGGRPDPNAVQEAIRRIVGAAHPVRIILFGSAARGEMRDDSDLDMLVVCKPPLDRVEMTSRIYEGLLGVEFPVDVLVVTEESLAKTRDNPGFIYGTALEEGREIYLAGA